MMIRHAEKPGPKSLGSGFGVDGSPDKKSLVIGGWVRAGAWAAFFGTPSANSDCPRPISIYAAKPDDDDASSNPSKRPDETIMPLSARLRIDPVISFAKGEEEQLAARLAQLTGPVLVCWEHKSIVEALIPALIRTQQIPGVPSQWDDARFDVVLRFDRALPNDPWSFRQVFPRLLAGDGDLPL